MNKLIIPAAEVIRKTELPNKLGFVCPEAYVPALNLMLDKMDSKGITQLSFQITLPKKPKSTGIGSQNNHFWGHCDSIAKQMVDENHNQRYTVREIEQAFLRMSVDEGYPTKMSPDGIEVPIPWSEATSDLAALAIEVVHMFAKHHHMWLIETDPATGEEIVEQY